MKEGTIMALIACPECGKEVSNKSRACIHCGCPLINTKCNINGTVYDFSEELPTLLLERVEDYLPAFGEIRMKTLLKISDTDRLIKIIKQIKEVPETFTPEYPLEAREKLYGNNENSANSANKRIHSITCPYCNSMNTRKITTTSKVIDTAVWGIFGTKRNKQWHCNNCGSEF
jgi:uncharacterized protein YbaR (Trm112 family)